MSAEVWSGNVMTELIRFSVSLASRASMCFHVLPPILGMVEHVKAGTVIKCHKDIPFQKLAHCTTHESCSVPSMGEERRKTLLNWSNRPKKLRPWLPNVAMNQLQLMNSLMNSSISLGSP